jgi:gamma-glutamyltranspeptidase/glutathione hydrolase
MVDAWCTLSALHGRLPLEQALRPAQRLARAGIRVSQALADALRVHRGRLVRGGAGAWALFDAHAGAVVRLPQLASALERIGTEGRSAYYHDDGARVIARAVRALGGTLAEADLAIHETVLAQPIATQWATMGLATQPPMAQGILLNMAVQALGGLKDLPPALYDHACIELTNAAFAYRSQITEGRALLSHDLPLDLTRASLRGGPRAYLHTAGVATVDGNGMVVSSLVSVFDDFGSCVLVPEMGFTLNNRAGGFTEGANAAAPGRRPVHTLAPAMVTTPQGVLGLATPGADGQVQTLQQVLVAIQLEKLDLARAIARPRWRSENGSLLIEKGHPGIEPLRALGHRIAERENGDLRFGAVVSAGWIDGEPVAAADWRRDTAVGVV